MTPVQVSQAYSPGAPNPPAHHPFTGIWDTGATCTVVTQKVVDACGLVPRGMEKVGHALGEDTVNSYLINLGLPNGITVTGLKVIWGKFINADVLVGMDIINLGDFSVSNMNGITRMSFRMPSLHQQDFVKGTPAHSPGTPSRNERCPCGSGKKYKYCCGAKK